MMYSCGCDCKVKAWSIANSQLKYEFAHGSYVYDIVIGREGTPFENRLVSISAEKCCRVSNLETGAKLKRINLDSPCWAVATDRAQTVIAIGTNANVTFIETTNFTKVKEILLKSVYSLAFSKRNDYLLAVTGNGEVHSLKF